MSDTSSGNCESKVKQATEELGLSAIPKSTDKCFEVDMPRGMSDIARMQVNDAVRVDLGGGGHVR